MAICDRLKYARERANLTGSQVRDRIGIGESSISDFENGKREPSLSQLQAMASAYRRSISFFLDEAPIPEEEAVLWREKPRKDSEDVEAHFLQLCQQYHNLEMWAEDEMPVRLPQAPSPPEKYSYTDAEKLAKQVRDELQLGDRPALSLLPVLEEVCGIKIFHLPFDPTGTAASTISETFGAAVLLNSKNARWRRNHDLAHELFHLLTRKILPPVDKPGGTASSASDRDEKFPTCFARNLLMPAEATRTAVDSRLKNDKLSCESLYDIARQFDVSVESLLWHMHFVYGRRFDDQEKTRDEIQRAKELAPLFGERQQSDPPILPDRYKALAIKALRRGEMSIGRFAEYLSISRQEAMRYIEQEVTEDEEVQITPA